MSCGDLSPSSLSPAVTPSTAGCLANQVPKYGTIIPNRIFVGGIATNTTDQELKVFFSTYGAVKDTKIICDRAGVSKGYGFVTFETQEDAEKIIRKESENLVFKDRKLNIGPAVRKQQAYPAARIIEQLPAGASANTMFIAPSAYGYPTAASGLTVMPSTDITNYQTLQQQVQPAQVANYSNAIPMIPQPLYMPHHYQYATTQIPTQPTAQQALQYATNSPWLSPRCYQPAAVTVSTPSTSNYMYSVQPELMYATAAAAGQHAQVLEVADGTLVDNQALTSEADTRCSVVPSNSKECTLHMDNGQALTSMMSAAAHNRAAAAATLQPAPPMHSYHSHSNMATAATAAPQPPPIKKMSPMPPSRLPNMVVVKPGSVSAAKSTILPSNAQRIGGVTMAYMAPATHHRIEDMRVKFEHDGHLAANIAPPTPPSTPASASGN